MNRILIDTGYSGGRSCSGERLPQTERPAYRIGRYLEEMLDGKGFETLLSDRVPELCEEGGGGRPSVCAALARRWRADCLLRLCVRPSRLPSDGEVEAFANRRDADSRLLSRLLIEGISKETMLRGGAVHPSSSILLLRKVPCPASVLLLRLPFSQQEKMTEREAHAYAKAIADSLMRYREAEKNR